MKNIFISEMHEKDVENFTSDFGLFLRRVSDKPFKHICNLFTNANIIYQNYGKGLSDEEYFKSLNNFAKSELNADNKINDKLDLSITSQDEADLSTPILYNNLANPITLSYINSNIKTDYTFTDTSTPITYDGTLLPKCNISLDDISCSFSFDVCITNNLDEKYKCTVFVDVPLTSNDESIENGSITLIIVIKNNYIEYTNKSY